MIQVIAAILTIIMFALFITGVVKSKRLKDKQEELKQVQEDEDVFDIEEQIVERGIALKEREKTLNAKKEQSEDVK